MTTKSFIMNHKSITTGISLALLSIGASIGTCEYLWNKFDHLPLTCETMSIYDSLMTSKNPTETIEGIVKNTKVIYEPNITSDNKVNYIPYTIIEIESGKKILCSDAKIEAACGKTIEARVIKHSYTDSYSKFWSNAKKLCDSNWYCGYLIDFHPLAEKIPYCNIINTSECIEDSMPHHETVIDMQYRSVDIRLTSIEKLMQKPKYELAIKVEVK